MLREEELHVGCQDVHLLRLGRSNSSTELRCSGQAVRDLRLGKAGGRRLLGESGPTQRVQTAFWFTGEANTVSLLFESLQEELESSRLFGTKMIVGMFIVVSFVYLFTSLCDR